MRSTQQPSAAMPRHSIDAAEDRELRDLRVTCWRQAHEIHSLLDTVAVLRAGADRLAVDNVLMSVQLAAIER
jgi:hypothetical protein